MTSSISITLTWHMGHRLPNHRGACRQLHGHTYTAILTLTGSVNQQEGSPSEGMIVDFTQFKLALRTWIDEQFDHKFLVHMHDPFADQLRIMPGVRVVPFVPTAENLAAALLQAARVEFEGVTKVTLYETPTSCAEISI